MCLNTGAVHIEKMESLETDAFLNGFRRFISRRSHPLKTEQTRSMIQLIDHKGKIESYYTQCFPHGRDLGGND